MSAPLAFSTLVAKHLLCQTNYIEIFLSATTRNFFPRHPLCVCRHCNHILLMAAHAWGSFHPDKHRAYPIHLGILLCKYNAPCLHYKLLRSDQKKSDIGGRSSAVPASRARAHKHDTSREKARKSSKTHHHEPIQLGCAREPASVTTRFMLAHL